MKKPEPEVVEEAAAKAPVSPAQARVDVFALIDGVRTESHFVETDDPVTYLTENGFVFDRAQWVKGGFVAFVTE